LPFAVAAGTDGTAIGSGDATTFADGTATGRLGVGSGRGNATNAIAAIRTVQVLAVISIHSPLDFGCLAAARIVSIINVWPN
jgi:hypothetical protein